MSDNPAKIAKLQNDKLVETLRSKNLGVPVCRHIESKAHTGQQFVKPEYVIETFPSVEFLRSINLIKAQIRTLVSVRKELHVETSTVPYLENNSNNNNSASAAASSSSPSTTTSGTTLTAEETEKLLQEAAPLLTNKKYSEAISLYSKVVDIIFINESDPSLKQILSRALSNRSGCFLGLKKSKKALDDARQCVDVRPSWIRAHLRVAEAAEELEEFDVAISAYQAAMTAEDRSGNVPSTKQLEAEILRVQQKQFMFLVGNIDGSVVPPAKVRDALISALKYCTCSDSAEFIYGSIINLAGNSASNKVLFGTASVRDAMLTVSKYCISTDSAHSFCFSIFHLTLDNAANKVLFGTASVREALVAVSKYCTSTESAASFCNSIFNLTTNDNNRILFGTPSVRDAIVAASKYCTTPQSAADFCNSIFNPTLKVNNKIVFGTASVRDAIIAASKYCTTPQSSCSLCGIIFNLSAENDNNQVLFGTASIRDAMVAASKYLTTPRDAGLFCRSISDLIENDNNKILFGTASVRNAILAVSKYCTTSESAGYFLLSICKLTVNDNNNNRILFGTASVRDAILTVSKYCTRAFSALVFCRSIAIIVRQNEANQVLFGTAAVRDALLNVCMLTMSKHCTDLHSASQFAVEFCRSIGNLVFNNEANTILIGTAAVRDALLNVSKYCVTTESAEFFCRSIANLTVNFNNNNRIIFGTASVRDVMINVSKYCVSPNSASYFCIIIENIISHNESNRALFATEAIRDALLSVSGYINDLCGVYTCCHVISLCHETNPTLFCVEKTVTSLVKLSKIEMKKQSPESVYWFLDTVLTLLRSDQKLFDTTEIRVAVERFQNVVNDPEEVEKLEKKTLASDKLSAEEYIDRARQLCIEIQKVVSEKSVASSAACAD